MAQSLPARGIRHAWRIRVSGTVLASALVLSLAPGAQAATVTNAWLAKVGTGGANGTASMQTFTTGVGNVTLKLKGLKASTWLPVALLKTSCKGSTLLTLTSIKTTSARAAVRTSSLTAAQVTAIKKATAGTGKIAIRIGTGTTAKCGIFVPQLVRAYVAAKFTVGPAPSGIAVDPTGVWVTSWWDNTITRIDPTTNDLHVHGVQLPGNASVEEIASGGGSLWVTTTEWNEQGDALPGYVLRVDPATGNVLATINGGKTAYDLVYGHGAVWVANVDDNTVLRIDPATNQVVARIAVESPLGIASDAAAIWVSGVMGLVSRIDPVTNQVVSTIQTQLSGGFVAAGAGAIWVTSTGGAGSADGFVSRINPTTNEVVATIPVGDYPYKLVVAGGSVWVGLWSGDDMAVVRINAASNEVLSRTTLGHSVYSIDATDHAVWAVHNVPFPEGTGPLPAGEVVRIGY